MDFINVACIQMDVLECNKPTNISKAIAMAEEAVLKGAELLVFPEVFSTGFCYLDMEGSAESLKGNTLAKMSDFSKKHGCILVFSIIEKNMSNDSAYYNLGVCMEDGDIVGIYRKTHPFKREKQYFSPGDTICPIVLKRRDLTIGLQICYEIRFPEVARKLALEGSDILVTIAEFPAPRQNIWKSLAIARSIENQIPHIACNRVGNGYDSSFFGGSVITDALGNVGAEAGDEEVVLLHQLELEMTSYVRENIPVFKDRRPYLY
ncbi:MAG: nitrilase-related carbon-nitrogen hydrolase [Methanolobus sp.]|nr:nitrilase-related carbon-nitrogen hydrolase [Methanolobus sp.]